ncbi:hypothetical protein [Phytoactinopolyspora endophytica]|uniref:hypothetical protein n=1 Tax=Phytoactinopolyspora endophytica TaxID=1642495 RepID=UPI0013E9B74B|nr:hypothetical protein [Phytoactinopolyspora endophytica]
MGISPSAQDLAELAVVGYVDGRDFHGDGLEQFSRAASTPGKWASGQRPGH